MQLLLHAHWPVALINWHDIPGNDSIDLLSHALVAFKYQIIPIQKQSFLLGPVNEKLHTLLSTGLIDKWIQDVVANSSNCETVSKMVGSHQSSEQRPFSLEEMASFFFIILIGHFMATLGFALEAIKKGCSG